MTGQHVVGRLEPIDLGGGLVTTTRDQLDDIEFGDRVSWELLMERCALIYSSEADRLKAMAARLFTLYVRCDDPASVAMALDWAGLPADTVVASVAS